MPGGESVIEQTNMTNDLRSGHGGQKLPFEKTHLSTSPPHSQPHYTNQETYLREKETDCFLNWSSFQY